MIKKLIVCAGFLLLGLVAYAKAETGRVERWNPGGSVAEYIGRYNEIREVEGKLVIDGPCLSACTLYLGLVPSAQVCATPFGLLGFHSASVYSMAGERVHSPAGTRLIWNIYPKAVQDALRSKGWDAENEKLEDHHKLLYFPATDFTKPCGDR